MTETATHAHHPVSPHAKLLRMSSQIANFFRHLPEEDGAAETARHINLYWSRSMRRDFGRNFTADSPDLHPLLRRAWPLLRLPPE